MKVCWLSNYFSPYALKQFEYISSHVDLTLVMLGGADDNRNDEWKLNKENNLKIHIIDKNYSKLIKRLAKENDIFVDSMYSSIYGALAVQAFKKENKKIIMQADGGIAIDRGFLINGILSYLMNRHDCFLSSGPHCDNYFKFYKVDENKINHYRFSSLTKEDINKHKELLKNKDELKDKLKISKDKFILLSVGKPVKGKGFDILLNAYIKSNLEDKIDLYIAGGEPMDEIKEIIDNNNLKNIHFVGLLNKKELMEYYAIADAFMLCTRTDVWGLVINEAMSFGLPVITSNNCGAGVHFNMLTKNVRIEDVEDTDSYSKDIIEVYELNNKEKVKEELLHIIEDYTIEQSSEDILEVLNSI